VAEKRFIYKCVCGESHEGSPNYGFPAPDAFLLQPDSVKAAGAHSRDFCAYQDRHGQRLHFARVALAVPIQGSDDSFLWGLWVQLGLDDYRQYLDAYEQENAKFRFSGWIRNNLPFYPPTDGIPVSVVPRGGRQLASIQVPKFEHRLSADVHEGMEPLWAAKLAASFCLAVNRKIAQSALAQN